MEVNNYINKINPYRLLTLMQSEEDNCNYEVQLVEALFESIDADEAPLIIKNNIEDLVSQVERHYFTQGMKIGAQMYVALMERQEEEF